MIDIIYRKIIDIMPKKMIFLTLVHIVTYVSTTESCKNTELGKITVDDIMREWKCT